MASFDYRDLRGRAEEALRAATYSPKKLVLIHSAVSLGLGLLLNILHYALDLGIAQTGGLSGITARTTLETIETILSIFNSMVLPFWQIGFIFAILQLARRQDTTPSDLLHGLRCWGPVLRSRILQGILYFGAIMMGTQIVSTIYLMTPAAHNLSDLLLELSNSEVTDPFVLLENEKYMAAMMDLLPFQLIGCAVFVIPLYYRLRFMDYVIMDQPEKGAFYAMARSLQMTHRRCWQLVKLDLRFWWYFGLELLIAIMCYGDLLLPLLGLTLPVDTDIAMFAFDIAALLCQLGLYVWRKNQVFATYALAYEQIRIPRRPAPRTAERAPGKMPWTY